MRILNCNSRIDYNIVQSARVNKYKIANTLSLTNTPYRFTRSLTTGWVPSSGWWVTHDWMGHDWWLASKILPIGVGWQIYRQWFCQNNVIITIIQLHHRQSCQPKPIGKILVADISNIGRRYIDISETQIPYSIHRPQKRCFREESWTTFADAT